MSAPTKMPPAKNVGAVRAVKRYTADAEWRELWDMLGVANGDRVAPDDTRTISMSELNKMGGEPAVGGRDDRRPETSTAPDALRTLQVAAPPAPKAKPAPRPFTPTRGFNPDACGENRGYMRHKRAGQEPCPPCRRARAAEERKNKARREAAK